MTDDLAAQIQNNSMTDSCYKDRVISTPLVLQLIKAHLDRDRKMKAELLDWFEDELLYLQEQANDDADGQWYGRLGTLRAKVAKKIIHEAEATAQKSPERSEP